MDEPKLPLCVKLAKTESAGRSILDVYYEEVNSRVIILQENIAPYQETIDKVDSSISAIDEELEALYSRISALEEQKSELLDVAEDTNKSMDKIIEAHSSSLLEYNTSFFKRAAKDFKVPVLADESKSWTVDLQYYPTFFEMFLLEDTPELDESLLLDNPDDDDDDSGDMSDWIGTINN